jgi:hypothetical protein
MVFIHSTTSIPCFKGRIHEAGWIKEIWHDGGYTDENATTNATSTPIIGRWIGWKVIIYNINHNKTVRMLSPDQRLHSDQMGLFRNLRI